MKLKWPLDLQKLCGQAYDGAEAMSGKSKGVAARTMEQYPSALYTQFLTCAYWNLPSDVRNMDIADKVARYFYCLLRHQLALERHINQLHQEQAAVLKWKKLKELCKTGVSETDAFEEFLNSSMLF